MLLACPNLLLRPLSRANRLSYGGSDMAPTRVSSGDRLALTMRTVSPAPRAFVDSATGAPAFGSYTGSLPHIELGPTFVDRAIRRKKWVYVAIGSDSLWVSLAVVRMGYATSAFAFVFDRASARMLVDRAILAPPRAAEVADDPSSSGTLARFAFGRSSVVLERHAQRYDLRARFPALDLDVMFDVTWAPPAIAAIAKLGPSLASATEKRVLAEVRGSAVVAGRPVSLDGALAGYDYTHGLMPRHTRWNWAFAMGKTKDGAPIAFNVVEGFVGEAECAVFCEDRAIPIREPHFEYDVSHPHRPWRLRGEGLDLTFEVGAVHEQRNNLGLVRSRFLQPVGKFRGTLRVGDRDECLEDLCGVVEDQDVLW